MSDQIWNVAFAKPIKIRSIGNESSISESAPNATMPQCHNATNVNLRYTHSELFVNSNLLQGQFMRVIDNWLIDKKKSWKSIIGNMALWHLSFYQKYRSKGQDAAWHFSFIFSYPMLHISCDDTHFTYITCYVSLDWINNK